ncbi:MAG: alpha/beta hydrolase [Candidatus Aenigmatarchaeota archaeon]|nr:alpha/beta hydrolase [Nanoarchaeota archaeon]
MTNVFIFHGVEGHPKENWFDWLRQELEKLDCNVFVPQFPTPENQTLGNWLAVLDEYKKYLNDETILVGHSLGVPFALNVAERNQVKSTFLVSGFIGLAGNAYDEGMKSFAQRIFDWERIKENCKNFFVFHSDNDPYIKLEKAEELAEKLGVDVILVKNAGHFNKASGYTKFELLLEKIKSEL